MGIRAARHGDLEQLLPLLRGYCDFYESSPSDVSLRELARRFIEMPDDEGYLLVAEGDGKVVGFALCQWKWSSLRGGRIVVLDDLFVAESARGRGHADALIAAAAHVARKRGSFVLTWLTGQDNGRAQAVYNRAGATAEPYLEYELEL